MINIAIYTKNMENGRKLLTALKETRKEHIHYTVTIKEAELLKHSALDAIPLDIAIINLDLATPFLTSRLKVHNPRVLLLYLAMEGTADKQMDKLEPYRVTRGKDWEEFVKNFNEDMEEAITRINIQFTSHFYFKKNHMRMSVDLSRVLYFKSDNRVIVCVLRDDKKIKFYDKLDRVQTEIEKITNLFVRINKSHYINRMYIRESDDKKIVLATGEEFTVKYPINVKE